MGTIVKLKGITNKGRNRIREHGELWTIEREGFAFGMPNFLCRALEDNYLKWSCGDFEIVGEVDNGIMDNTR